MDELAELIRQRIATRLSALKLTAITAATRAELPRDTIRNLFRQEASTPRADTLVNIAAALDTTVSYLVGEIDFPGRDYADAELVGAANQAMETAKPIPVCGYAEWGLFEQGRHMEKGEFIELLWMNVPGFLDAPLLAVLVTDEHCGLAYPEGRYVIFVMRDVAGLRDGDHVVCTRRRGAEIEFTVRELVTNAHRGAFGGRFVSGGLVSLSEDEERFPSRPFPPAGTVDSELEGLVVAGVVVADLAFHSRRAEPGLFPGIEPNTLTVQEQDVRAPTK